jgi:hypothetical protein
MLLWGILFILVLTMISGARELMTPGAWEKQGFTYRLKEDTPASERETAKVRKQHLDQLRLALWRFAAMHNGRFPTEAEAKELATDLWIVPDAGGLHYFYVPGLSASQAPQLLIYEPELDPDQRLVLQTNGEIVSLRSTGIQTLLNRMVTK